MTTIPSGAAADQALWATQSVSLSASDNGQAANLASANEPTQAGQSKLKDVGQQFEAMFLRQMLEECMPKDSQALFGEGTAGTVWRSMLADSMATTLSKSGTIGIAQMIMKHEPSGSKGK
jgi:Rod binding domain-containing protein